MTVYEPGSRVRITLEATFLHDSTDFNGLLYVTNDQGGTHSIPQVQTIELVAPKPEAYEHIVVNDHGGVARSICGKVWRPNRAAVTVVGKCPTCMSLVESGWVA